MPTAILSELSTAMLIDRDAEIGEELDGFIEDWYAEYALQSVPSWQASGLLAERLAISEELRARNVPLELMDS